MRSDILQGQYGFDIAVESMAIMVLLILSFSLIRERLINKAYSKYILLLAITQIVMIGGDLSSYVFWEININVPAVKFASLVSFTFMMLAVFLFNCFLFAFLNERVFVDKDILYLIAFVCGATAALDIIGLVQPNPWFFTFTEEGEYITYKAMYVLLLIPLLVLIFDIMLIWNCRKSLNGTELFTWMSYEAFPIISLGFSFFGLPESVSYSSGALSVLLLYANLHVVRTKELADDKLELSESKVKLLISQMQPHFMYNSLNSIYYLIGKDPELAKDALDTFSSYLRSNINSLKDVKTVPLTEELKHIEAYLKLEKLRFGDDLNFELDIKDTNFSIPVLSIQPLVENAVKHGVSQKEEGGTVKISTYSDEENYYVKIEDDGVGFDAGSYKDNQASTHVGIFNVNSRIQIMCHGKLSVTSEVGKGTVSLVTLPKDGQKAFGNEQ